MTLSHKESGWIMAAAFCWSNVRRIASMHDISGDRFIGASHRSTAAAAAEHVMGSNRLLLPVARIVAFHIIAAMVRYRIGTMGYAYTDWRGPFYPARMGQGKWLGYYAGQFDSLELNTTFHAQPTAERLRRWASMVGPDFRFAMKTSRAITHDQPLASAAAPMLEFVETARNLGGLLGPILIQLPPHRSADAFNDLDKLLGALPKDLRYAVEFRHDSWIQDRTTDMLRRHNAAWVGLDHLDHRQLRRLRATADFLYVRLVGRHGRFGKINTEQVDVMPELHKWREAIAREIDASHGRIGEAWVLVNNDYTGHAPATLRRLAGILGLEIRGAPAQEGLFG